MVFKSFRYFFIVLFSLSLLCLALPFFIPVSKAQKSIEKPFDNSSFTEINNMLIHYRTWYAEDTAQVLPWVLLVHGMGGSTFAWRYNVDALLNTGFNVVAVDVPPYGFSDRNPDFNHAIDQRAGLLWSFLEWLNPDTGWHLVGHSMGGGIVQCMAIMKPEKTEKVVFVGGALFRKLEAKRYKSQYVLMFKPIERLLTVIGEGVIIKPKRIAQMLVSAFGTDPGQEVVDAYYKALAVPGTAQAVIRSFSKQKPSENIDGLALKRPSLSIWGGNDTWVPYEAYKSFLDLLPMNRTFIIEDAGHCPMETHAEFFNKELVGFLLH